MKIGYAATIFSFVAGALHHKIPYYFYSCVCLSIVFIILVIRQPQAFRLSGTILSSISKPFQKAISALILSSIFLLLFIPISIFSKIIKRDTMGKTFLFNQNTYWITNQNIEILNMQYQF